MNEMIKIEDGFQYSVNIAYDLQNKKKLQSFIPTHDALKFIEEILLSTKSDSTERARVLVGAYGKGKSHLVLTVLNLLKDEPLEKFPKLKKEIEKEAFWYIDTLLLSTIPTIFNLTFLNLFK